MHAEVGGRQERVHVSPDGVETDVPQREKPGPSGHDVETRGEYDSEPDRGGHPNEVGSLHELGQ